MKKPLLTHKACLIILVINANDIERSKIRGVESLGMLCAEDELGIG